MKGSFMLLNKLPRLALALRHAVFAGGESRGMHQILNFTSHFLHHAQSCFCFALITPLLVLLIVLTKLSSCGDPPRTSLRSVIHLQLEIHIQRSTDNEHGKI